MTDADRARFDRRQFFACAAVPILAFQGTGRLEPRQVWSEAQALIAGGAVGEVRFCRVSNRALLPAVYRIVHPHIPAVEVSTVTPGVTVLGTRATLLVNARGWRCYQSSSGE